MSIGREEFERLLRAAVGAFTTCSLGAAWRFAPPSTAAPPQRTADPSATWTIDLVPLEPRRLGDGLLPRHRVNLLLAGFSENERHAFMNRFDRAFLRGGG